MKIVTSKLKALPGARVFAKNYRTKNLRWEEGEVFSVIIQVDKFGNGQNKYRVRLDRTSKRDGHIFVTVGDDGIE